MSGLIDSYPPALLTPESPLWELERALCTAAALLERDVDVIFDKHGPTAVADQLNLALGEEAFALMWADLLEACGSSAELVPLVVVLAEAPMDLDELIKAAERAAS